MSVRPSMSDLLRLMWILLAVTAAACAAVLISYLIPPLRDAVPAIFARGGSTVALLVSAGMGLLFVGVLWTQRARIDALAAGWEAEIRDTGRLTPDEPGPRETIGLGRALLGLSASLAIVVLSLAVFSPGRYFLLVREDGPVEYASALLWMLAALLIILSLITLRPRRRILVLGYLGLAIFFFVCGGEEVSWGQRILDRESGEFFERVNKQNETNLHNIGSISIFSNLFFLLSLVVFVLLPWLPRRFPDWRRWLLWVRAPYLSVYAERVYHVGLVVFVIVGLRFQTLGFSPWSRQGWYNQMDDEIFEFFAALSYFCLAMLDLAWRRRNRALLSAVDS